MKLTDREKELRFKTALDAIDEILDPSNIENTLQNVCVILSERIPYFDWVGFYLVDREREGELVLGPFVGAPTEHVRIPFGKGICGQAAERKETFVVQDVSQEDNYLACSVEVKSEIVVPIMSGDRVLGELDIDSHELEPFSDVDRRYLETLCNRLATLFGE